MRKVVLLLLFVLAGIYTFAQLEFEFTNFNQTTTPLFGGNNFKAVAVAKGGYIYAGSQYNGAVVYIPATNSWDIITDISTDVLVTDIKADQNGNIWMANAGKSGLVNGGSNIGGGINLFAGDVPDITNFYTITGSGGLTSRNVRSIWIDKYHSIKKSKPKVWVAQGTYVVTNTTLAGGFSYGQNEAAPTFTKGYIGLQVTPYVTTANARTPSLLAVGGGKDEVLVFAQANFSTNQLLRYRADAGPHAFLGAYDHTNTPVLTTGFRANAIYFDDLERGWIGLQDGGVLIKNGAVWKTMNAPSVFPAGTIVNPNAITSDPTGYVYIGTSSGLVIYTGGPVDVATSYRRVTTADGLPTNNINGIAVDTFANRIVLAHSAGISFMKFTKKVKATLEWDYSFPKLDIKPKGVVADGTSRLYIKVRRDSSNIRPIKKISLAVKNVGTSLLTMVGKLKVANVVNQYSNEANSGTSTEVSRTDSTPAGDFYFWYVAPEDFSKDSLGAEAQLSEREDSIKVKVTYTDDTEDSSYLSVKVVRPPVIMGSMLNNAKKMANTALKGLGGIPLLQSDKYVLKLSLNLNAIAPLVENARRIIDGDLLQNEDKSASLQGSLEAIRKMGFAANRVDFIAHGIAGNALRVAAAIKKAKFYADGDETYNNYGQGFVNKFISINTPHNGTPVLDLVKEVVPRMSSNAVAKVAKILKAFPDTVKPYPVLLNLDSIFKPAENVIQKAAMSVASFKLPATLMKNHLIVSNVEMDPAVPKPYTGGGFLGGITPYFDNVLRDISPMFKTNLTAAMDSANSEAFKSLNMLNLYAQFKGLPGFSENSDLFSHLSSQAAGQALSLPNITRFTSDSADNVTLDGMLNFGDVGRALENLLNTTIRSAAFSDMIPANNTPDPADLQLSQKPITVSYDTNKVVTDDRQVITGQNLRTNADPTIILKYHVKDTVGLQYVYINFQDSMYTTTSKARNQQVTLKIRKAMAYSGVQQLEAVGVYETADSITYHADTLRAFVTPPAIQDFRVKADEVELYDDLQFQPDYEVKVNGAWQDLPSNDTAIKKVIEKPTVLKYDSAGIAFTAINDGYSRAYFTYKTYKDTVAFVCVANGFSAINQTIVNGNFKDSATWSKGRPPLPGDSIIISAGHNIVLDTTAQIRSLRIENGGTLTLNTAAKQLQLGDAEDGDFVLDNYGTLNISAGNLVVKGRVKLNAASTFNMTGGTLVVDGNTGYTITSLQNGLFVFEAAPLMNSFSFTGGTLQIVDPPLGLASQALNCPYPFGKTSTLMLGNGVSLTASNNPNGFGGSTFPPEIGQLILDAGTTTGNRQFTITKPLSVKGTMTVRSGSHISLEAPVSVTQ